MVLAAACCLEAGYVHVLRVREEDAAEAGHNGKHCLNERFGSEDGKKRNILEMCREKK